MAKVEAAFVANMEDVLEVYEREYSPKHPWVCLDEKLKELIGDSREPLPAKPGQPYKQDYEYKRNGTRNLFVIIEPLRGYRKVFVTERRTSVDYARVLKWLVDEAYPQAEWVEIVQDNLNTHGLPALYEAFPPEEARRIARKVRFHFTPKHASWLNMAEIEIGAFETMCLSQRIGDEATLERHVAALEAERNAAGATINWQFTNVKVNTSLTN